jgi:carbon monoxide dehydrogenase subunit G
MELQGERLLPATIDETWAALNDPSVLQRCIAGCESLEATGDAAYSAGVALKVGPVSARFKGKLQLTDIEPPRRYTIHFDGQGGVAGFGKGSADVALAPEGAQTRLGYTARAQVGGKMAQVGSRLIDAAAAKITEDFFKAFEAQLQARDDAPEGAAGEVAEGAGAEGEAPHAAGTTDRAEPLAAAAPAARRTPSSSFWWGLAAVVVLVAIYFLSR